MTISILSHSDFHCLYTHPFLVFLFLFFNLRADILSSSSCWRKFWMALNITQTLWLAILSFNCKEKLFFKLKQWRLRPANALIAKRDKVLAGDSKLLVINEYRQIIFGQNEMLFTHLIIYLNSFHFFSLLSFSREHFCESFQASWIAMVQWLHKRLRLMHLSVGSWRSLNSNFFHFKAGYWIFITHAVIIIRTKHW